MPLFGPQLSGPADLTNLLASGLADRPGQPALISGRRVRTWEQLEQDIATLAAGLTALGLQQGDRVASLVPNRGELLLHYLACLRAGLVVAPLNYRYTPAEIDHALDVSQSSVLVAHAERADDVRASALASRLTLGVVSVGGALDDARRFEDLLSSDEPTVDLPTPDFGAAAFVFFTSGSTGKPKGVTHSLSSFGCIASGWAESMALTVDDVVLPGSSIAHVGSLATSLAALSAGATVIVPHSLDPADLLLLLREHRPTHLLTTSASLISLGRLDDAAPDDFASLRLCMSGGDTFPPNLAREFADRTGAVVHQTYGLTEATSCMFNASATKVGSPGVLCPGYAASLRDERGQEVAVDVEANLWVSGDPVMVGYWRDPHATAASIVDGWFDTGDVMRVDAEGYFWFCGRKKQIIVHDGSNIAPQEVEAAVMTHPAVELAGVVGVPDEVHGENVWAFVTLKEGVEAPPAEDIIQAAKGKVGYKAPEAVLVLDAMPMNASGKVDRLALSRLAADRLG